MLEYIEDLIQDTYYLNIPMPVVSITELNLNVKNGERLTGQFEIINSEEGYFTGIVETVNQYVEVKNRLLKGNDLIVEYEVDPSQINESIDNVEDGIIITYNGGEILIPVNIKMIPHDHQQNNKRFIPKKSPKKLSIKTNQFSYGSEETGFLQFTNPSYKKVKISINNEEGYIILKETEFELVDEKQVNFHFKIPKLDRILGKIPLKTHPKFEMKLQVSIRDDVNEHQFVVPVFLTELETLPSRMKISSRQSYQNLLHQLLNEYSVSLLTNTKNKITDLFMEQFKALINYDKTNIDLRLFYCYLAIESNKKEWALKEINDIDRYLIYYDNEQLEVSDLLLLFIEMIKGESVQGLVSRWNPNTPQSLFKILLKNRLMTHNHSSYADYKALYQMGIKNRFLFTDAVIFLNSSPLIPLGEDAFYKAMLTWAIRKRVIGMRWLKKIENNYEMLIQNNNMNIYIAEQLYLIDSSKNMLTLLCLYYLKFNYCNEKALSIYEKAISERVRLDGLEIAYIMAAYKCNQLINIGYLKMSVRVDRLEEPYQSYFLLNILVGKERYKHLYFYYTQALESMAITCFKENLVPDEPEEKKNYIEYLLDTKQYGCVINLFHHRRLNDLDIDLYIKIVQSLYPSFPKQGLEIARYCYDNGICHEQIAKVVASGFKGSLKQLLELNDLLKNNEPHAKQNLEAIIVKGILTRKYPEIIMEKYVDYYNLTKGNHIIQSDNKTGNIKHSHTINIHKLAQHFIAAQILIEELQPSQSVILLLEKIVENEENIYLYLALLKSYIKSSYKHELLVRELINQLVSKGIVFSWYLQLVPKSLLGERVRIQQYFEYNSQPDIEVIFNYRFDDEVEYSQLKMKHVALGLYIVSIVMFYNESIQYYIEEVYKDGSRDIKSSDYYTNKEISEQEEAETLFDLINTIEISKEMNDAISMEKTVAHYIMKCNKEIENMTIL